MTIVVLGVDALDADIVDSVTHPNLSLDANRAIDTISSSTGEPSTHELWPTIITGLPPEEHGLLIDEGVAWENPLIAGASTVSDYLLPDFLQTKLGAWLLNNTSEDAFRVHSSYYEKNGIETIFDRYQSRTIGIPNYVVDPNQEDREHQLRRNMDELFERDPNAKGGHVSSDPNEFYEQCLEMSMIRIARTRRALRSREHELVFGYTSGLDLIGHVSYSRPALQKRAYQELNDFVGELRDDLRDSDELILISDHGLQDGLHTDKAMIAATNSEIVKKVSSVLDVRAAVESELDNHDHIPTQRRDEQNMGDASEVREQLEDLGYM